MKYIPNAVTAKFARQILVAQKNSPSILFAAGVTGMVASTVLACKATLKVDDVLDRTEADLAKIADVKNRREQLVDTKGKPLYTEHDAQKDKALVYFRTTLELARLYAPAIVIGVASVTMLTKSHNTLTRRNAALTAAYTALDKGFRDYRARVQKKIGDEEERELYYDLEPCELEFHDTQKGPQKVEMGKKPGANKSSIYARYFDENSTSWNRTPEYNMIFLKAQQNYANDLLKARGHVFLNDVYDMLGIPRSSEGAVVGWVDNGQGDGYIDFGIFDREVTDRVVDFMIGREGGVWLDFNVDGVVYDKI